MISSLFSGQRILVTGSSGYIGPRLCQRLCKTSGEVHAVSRTEPSMLSDGLHWHHSDLSDPEAVRGLFKSIRPDVVFHLAGLAAGGREVELVLPTFHSNLTTTVNLLTVATEIGCQKIVYPGSLEEPGADEVEVIPSSPYAAGKWASSAYARMFHRLYGTPLVIVRVFMTYGPGRQNPKKLLPYVISSLLEGQAPKLSSGKREIDWIYIDDVVDGLIVATQATNVDGITIDLGSGSLVSIRRLVQKLVDMIDPSLELLFGAESDRPMEQVRIANVIDTYAKIGWRPKTDLEEGLRRTVDWYRRIVN